MALLVRHIPTQNVLLVIASLLFYAYGEPVYVLLMIVMSVASYIFGLLIGKPLKHGKKPARTWLMAGSVILCLGCLGVFKYADMLVGTFNAATGLGVPSPNIALPIGISFFTFQAVSYLIDVYRGDVEPQRNLMHVLLYISFFPQLIAGPIIRYHDIEDQLANRSITVEGVSVGLKRFIVGLAKKVLIADVLAVAVDAIYGADQGSISAFLAILAMFAYLLQIYFDFSAYSDMAIGMARMFGFTYKENFNYPYVSVNIQEFWRRWHISLSTWLKEYLYFSLGGNRKGRPRTVANKIFVFFCCGLWHGAAWTFVVWGLIHGFFLLLEEYVPVLRRLPKPLGWAYVIMVVALAFVLFRADTFEQAMFMYQQMLLGWGSISNGAELLTAQLLTPLFCTTFVVGIVASFPILPWLKGKVFQMSEVAQKRIDVVCSLACLGLLAICVLTLAGGAYSPFIYFRF